MFGYFRGWKRRAGLVTLALACLLAIGWVRSVFYEELFQIVLPDRFNGTHAIESSHSTISWTSMGPILDVGEIYWSSIHVGKERETALTEMWPQYHDFLRSKHAIRWQAPYWYLVLPLTLLSVSLLFSKHCQPTNLKPSQEPAA